jgi:hypothetical protein
MRKALLRAKYKRSIDEETYNFGKAVKIGLPISTFLWIVIITVINYVIGRIC